MRLQRLEVENSALTMRRKQVERELECLTATYGEMLESRQEVLFQNELLNQKLQNLDAVRDRILKNWRTAKAPEKRERIKEALDRFIEDLTDDSFH